MNWNNFVKDNKSARVSEINQGIGFEKIKMVLRGE